MLKLKVYTGYCIFEAAEKEDEGLLAFADIMYCLWVSNWVYEYIYERDIVTKILIRFFSKDRFADLADIIFNDERFLEHEW